MSFVERQTKNLQDVVEAAKLSNEIPEQLRTLEQHQRLCVTLQTIRCIRCGNPVVPLMALPGNFICETCEAEVRSWDKGAMVGSRWWTDIVMSQNTKPK